MADNYQSDATDLYSDTPAKPPGESKPDDTATQGKTAILPKYILAGKEFQPGDEVVLRIVRLMEKEVEVEYAPEKGEEGEYGGGEEEAPAPAPSGAGGEMASLMA